MTETDLELPDGLENALRSLANDPIPPQEFSKSLQFKLAQRQEILLRSHQPSSHFQRVHHFISNAASIRHFMQSRPLLALCITVIGLLLVSGLAFALGQLLIYIPGHGLVDPDAPVRRLASPVSQTRAGVTLTVRGAILAPDKTSIQFTLKGLPFDAIPQGTVEEKDRLCSSQIQLLLPDGSNIRVNSFEPGGYTSENEYQHIVSLGPVPAGVDRAKLRLDCLPGTLLGKAPQNWETDLQFLAGKPEGTAAPVIEISPSAAVKTETPPQASNPMVLDQVIETADGFIFIGRFKPLFAGGWVRGVTYNTPRILDANGDPYRYGNPAGLPAAGAGDGVGQWAYQVHEKKMAWPIRIIFDTVDISCPDQQGRFEFDAGSDPQPGQIWRLNQEVQAGGCSLPLAAVQRTQNGYIFSFERGQSPNQWFHLETPGYPSSGGPDSSMTQKYIDVHLVYPGGAPKGRVSVDVSNVTVSVPGPWQVQWQP